MLIFHDVACWLIDSTALLLIVISARLLIYGVNNFATLTLAHRRALWCVTCRASCILNSIAFLFITDATYLVIDSCTLLFIDSAALLFINSCTDRSGSGSVVRGWCMMIRTSSELQSILTDKIDDLAVGTGARQSHSREC